jgi:hypothetical protein
MTTSTFDPSPARRGLDLLLAAHPHLDLLAAWVPGRDEHQPMNPWSPSPWLMVELGQPSNGESDAYAIWPFAIWRSTGAVHGVDHDGAVSDDPLYTP